MNRKVLVAGALALALGGGVNALACEAHAKEKGKQAGGCPMHADGAKAAATADKSRAAGGKTAAAAPGKTGCAKCAGHGAAGKTASAAKAGVYACSMGDYAGPQTKDGRCPKCGMSLALKK